MEPLSITRLLFSFPCFFVMLFSATNMFNLASAHKICNFPAIFNFGDSNSDTGNFDASLFELRSPYGETFFHRPVGRGSDGRLIIDFRRKNFILELG